MVDKPMSLRPTFAVFKAEGELVGRNDAGRRCTCNGALLYVEGFDYDPNGAGEND